MKRKQAILSGMKMIFPLCVGDFPFSFIVGALSVGAGMSIWQSTAWSCIVIAGSAQMLALNMIKTGASIGVIVLTTLIINLRHVLYSASMSDKMRHYALWKKCLMAYGLTDEVYAVTVKPMQENKHEKVYFYMSAMLTFWFIWVVADFLGALLGAAFPNIEKYGLDFAMIAAFIAIVIPQVKSRACIIAAVVASVSGVLLVILPYSLGIVVASVLGVVAGLAVDLADEREKALRETEESHKIFNELNTMREVSVND
ncbi:AzlC family ABC transporter permease [Edwardsiella piscicida]|uniref:Branched-chain amino acid ABC transporter permease n=3 Tax=Edwardsiella TaxID=635 RepID=A0A0H3DVE6_EDWTF|nr:amino acid transport protein [Edwardsiella tarda EIB202]ADM42598.1 hypothetical protein ETAF_2496 [Edwardsiella tarda FL6-60]ARD19001.1 branched-chain amino acid ABC transporter permease [Edwardsiella piscicida]QBB13036.1 branched-chain amino acid ABC transporter permease [Edwardsiella piscicida]QHR95029.1 branched-chain amino acid ABC transporter permease [Edwardsiella piscicida]